MTTTSDTCDGCSRQTPAHRLRLSGSGENSSNLYLCYACWYKEMAWRRLRNLDLAKEAQFEILAWEEA